MTFKQLLENSPLGSFEDLRMKVREAIQTLQNKTPFVIEFVQGEPIQRLPWVTYMFPDRVVVDWMDAYYEVSYKVGKKGDIKLGSPKKVEMVFQTKESSHATDLNRIATDIKEAGIVILKEKGKQDLDLDVFDFISLKEAKFDSETGELEVILIEQGTNMGKRRHYPTSTIQEAAPHFASLKMYIDHPTVAEDKAKPERSIKDWASTIIESHFDNGKAVAKIAVHDTWLRERLSDPVFRENVGLSINAGGQISYGKVGGQEVQIIEKIVMHRRNGPASVDWVTEAGARGRVSRLLKESKSGGKHMELNEATIEDIQRENPKLLESITTHVQTQIKESGSNEAKEKELKDLKEKNAGFEKKEKEATQSKLVESILEGMKDLNLIVKKRVAEQAAVKLFESETELKETVAGLIKSELEYVNQFSTKGKIKTGDGSNGAEGSLMESLAKELDQRAGVQPEKKEKTEE